MLQHVSWIYGIKKSNYGTIPLLWQCIMVVRYLFSMLFLPGTENGIPRKASGIISEQ